MVFLRAFVTFLILIFPILDIDWTEGSNVLLDPNLICKKPRRLRGKLADICRRDTGLLTEIINGINLGFRECEHQFKNHRWNCTALRRSMKKLLMKDTRETSFVNAITAAGITYAVTRACTIGNLMECSCDKSHLKKSGTQKSEERKKILSEGASSTLPVQRYSYSNSSSPKFNRKIENNTMQQQNEKVSRRKTAKNTRRSKKYLKNLVFPEGEWEWGGCSENVNFGFRKSKEFLDSTRSKKRSDIRTLVKIHNNNAGRSAIRDHMRLECKCHGLSGSCTVKTCWLKMPSFREIGARLKEKFDGAVKVIAHNDGTSFIPEGRTIKRPSKYDLVYTDDSPDFCNANYRTGSLGTRGRECNITSDDVDGCELLCCNRGYDHKIIKEKINCKCIFRWCCEVTCSTCTERRQIFTCR